MDEEQMWKGFFLKLHELKMNPPTEHEYQLQDGDGGFFEKFGSLLRQKSQLNENILRTPLSSLKEDIQIEENELIIEKPNHADPIDTFVEEILPPWAPTNDIGDTVFDSGTVMNVEDLYEEILFEIYNNIGCENNEGRIESLVGFAQDAFKIPNSTHLEISEVAVRKEPPNVRLNIEIIKAENLLSKDSNGLSDPFVTLYLESRNSHRYNSSVKPATLNPIWEEHFSLDFDAAETIKEKVSKLLDVKGVKGLCKVMKEIAVTASSGKHDNESKHEIFVLLTAFNLLVYSSFWTDRLV
ncbi:GL21942 [Drosophila persimilis]|uniref:GL21942 n=1 Tax=Drosophila persimilis TaxID=7234 RepID=B4GE32_DROPE|nr:GL21942 [Drosophila persimilis]